MRGEASGSLRAEELAKGNMLTGEVLPLDGPLGTSSEIERSFATAKEYAADFLSTAQTEGAGWYRIHLGFIGYSQVRDRESYSRAASAADEAIRSASRSNGRSRAGGNSGAASMRNVPAKLT